MTMSEVNIGVGEPTPFYPYWIRIALEGGNLIIEVRDTNQNSLAKSTLGAHIEEWLLEMLE